MFIVIFMLYYIISINYIISILYIYFVYISNIALSCFIGLEFRNYVQNCLSTDTYSNTYVYLFINSQLGTFKSHFPIYITLYVGGRCK